MSSSYKTPSDTAKAIVETGAIKNKSPLINTIILAFLAGAYIAFGGMFAQITTAGMADAGFPAGLVKLFFAGVFPVGLMLVLIAGAELFTGNIMYFTFGILEKKASIKGLIRNWTTSWIFNFIGSIFVAFFLAYLTGLMTDPIYAEGAIALASKKVALSWDQSFLRAIGCNWLVCLAVYLAFASDDIIGKIFGIWFPITAFVTIGFEHSVANMYFIPIAMLLGGDITIIDLFNNLIPVTLGNIVGAAIFVACAYWFVYLRKK
ncbi:formate/nitrite transporter family protein [Methanobrevibacter sp. DSM 116169]|uniref:formate/nitrite transporter family protein n=1 Tax=Methanobrevibacter sp. DSM 116169 TaxID=3242727 RepID=UPI0038FCFA35